MKVPFVDLNRQHQMLADVMVQTVRRLFERNDFILGESLEAFEEEFARYLGVPYAVGVASGTDALHLALRALGIGAGDEVIVPTLTFAATAFAVLYTGATPVFVDVEEDSLLLSVQQVEAAVTSRTRAVIPVHLGGQPCDMDALLALAQGYHLAIVEDACQAHGATYKGKAVGTFGQAGCFSFYPSKNLGACGDGGIVVTADAHLKETLVGLRNYGQRAKYHHEGLGFNSRLDSLQAALLRVKLPHLKTWNALRGAHAEVYRELLRAEPVTLPTQPPADRVHVYHLFMIRSSQRDDLQGYLTQHGIATGIHYPTPLHRLDVFGAPLHRPERYPIAERACSDVLSLPLFPELQATELRYVANTIHTFFQS